MDPSQPWPPAPHDLPLPRDVVHAFAFDLAPAPDRLDAYTALLRPDELEHAARYRFERHRRRYVAGRGQLRQVLGTYLRMDPARVELHRGAHGKPRLADATALGFNLSRSEDLALAAFCAGAEVGMDVEAVRPFPEAEGVVERFFAPEERSRFAALPAAARDVAFFRAWTRKEALLKSTGHGLSHPLHAFTVPVEELAAPCPILLETDGGPEERWLLPVPAPRAGYVACAAVGGGPRAVTCWRWPPA